jgi:integrase
MAEKKRFTKTMLDTLQPGDGGARIVWDTEIAGLGVRVTRGKDGATNRVLFLQFRVGKGEAAREVKTTLGSVRELIRSNADLEKTRAHAAELRLDARTKGLDPRNAPKPVPTFAQFGETYLAERKKDYADGGKAAQLAVDRASKAFGKKLIVDIGDADIEAFHRDIVKEFGPSSASKTLSLLSALFSRAEKKGLIVRSPTRHVKAMPSHPRDAVLTEAEMGRFWAALDQLANASGSANGGPSELDFADAIRLLALTGARKTEVIAMMWSEIDLENGTWKRAPERNKNRKKSEAPLVPEAVAILKAIRARRDEAPNWAKTSPFVFPSKLSGLGRMSGLHAPFKKVLALAGIDPSFHVHDLRATFITVALVNGMQPSLLRHLTGHSSTAVLDRVYNRLQSADVLREGLAGVAAVWGSSKALR